MGRWPQTTLRGAANVSLRDDDKTLLQRLFVLPGALTRQIPSLAYPGQNLETVTRHLYRLADRGILDRLRLGPFAGRHVAVHGGAVWYLTPAGREIAAATWGLDPEEPTPLAAPTTPRAAAQALAAAAVTEWVMLCRERGLDLRLALPGTLIEWPGWPPSAGKEISKPPPLLLAKIGASPLIAVDFLRAGGVLSAQRLAQYQEMLAAGTGSGIGALVVIGWDCDVRDLATGVHMANPHAAVQWLEAHCR